MCGGGGPLLRSCSLLWNRHISRTRPAESHQTFADVSQVCHPCRRNEDRLPPPVRPVRGQGGRLAPASRPTALHGCCAQCLPPSPAHRRTPGESFLPKCVLATSDRATNHPKTRWLKTTYQSPCSRGGTEHFLCFLWSQAGHSGDGKSKAAWSTAGRLAAGSVGACVSVRRAWPWRSSGFPSAGG